MIGAVEFLPVVLILDPAQHHLAVPVTRRRFVPPQVLPHGEAGVEGDVECGRQFRIQRSAFVFENPVVEKHLQSELIRVVPRLVEILRQNAAELGGGAAVAVVGDNAAFPIPRIEISAIGEDQISVESGREVVGEDSAGGAFVGVLSGGRFGGNGGVRNGVVVDGDVADGDRGGDGGGAVGKTGRGRAGDGDDESLSPEESDEEPETGVGSKVDLD